MRPHVQRAGVAAGTLFFAAIGAAAVPVAAHADTHTAEAPVLRVADRVTAGTRTTAQGKAPGHFGRSVALYHRAGARGEWVQLATTEVGRGDRFRFRVRVPRSGVLRAAVMPDPETAFAASGTGATSNHERIAVARAVRIARKDLHVKSGRRTSVAGRVAPGTAGVPVALKIRRSGRWSTIDRSRTRAGGRYRLRAPLRSTGVSRSRVVARGADGFARGRRKAGRIHVYRVAYASWYGPGLYGSPVACGGAPLRPGQLGVAHKSLPCGTKVTFRRGNRSVTVRVIDRGPYVGGREYDLTEATARRLGFSGHGAILATR